MFEAGVSELVPHHALQLLAVLLGLPVLFANDVVVGVTIADGQVEEVDQRHAAEQREARFEVGLAGCRRAADIVLRIEADDIGARGSRYGVRARGRQRRVREKREIIVLP